MNKSENVNELFAAFVAFSAEVESVIKDKQVNAGRVRYKYNDLASLQDYVRPILAKHGLAVIQMPTTQLASDGSKITGLATSLVHSSGQWVGSFFGLQQEKSGCKEQGSAITYARRYGLAAILNLSQADDDGQAADGYAGRNRGQEGSSTRTTSKARSAPPTTPSTSHAHAEPGAEGAEGIGASILATLKTLDPADQKAHMALITDARNQGATGADYDYLKKEIGAHFVRAATKG